MFLPGTLPSDKPDKIYFPFSLFTLAFTTQPRSDITKSTINLPISYLNTYLQNLNNVVILYKTKIKWMIAIMLIFIILFAFDLVLALFDGSPLFYVIAAMFLIPIFGSQFIIVKISWLLLPKLERYVEQYNPNYEKFGIEWVLYSTKKYPTWLTLQIKSCNTEDANRTVDPLHSENNMTMEVGLDITKSQVKNPVTCEPAHNVPEPPSQIIPQILVNSEPVIIKPNRT